MLSERGLRLTEPEAERHAAFCRLEHLVVWAERDGGWRSGGLLDDDEAGEGLGHCVQCGDGLSYGRVLLRHRGPLRIGDAFCGVEHATEWAEAGGRWRVGRGRGILDAASPQRSAGSTKQKSTLAPAYGPRIG